MQKDKAGNIAGWLKSGVSRIACFSPWQRSFHDHIIRNEEDNNRIVEYIQNNPALWQDDCFAQYNYSLIICTNILHNIDSP